MKILSRHLFFGMVKPLIYLILAFMMLFIVADLMDNGVDFYRSDMSVSLILEYYKLILPLYLQIIIPICLLLSTLYSLSVLTRNGEIIAMRASGLSMSAIMKPYLFIGFICLFIVIFFIEKFPNNHNIAEKLKNKEKFSSETYKYKIDYVNLKLNHYWYIEEFNIPSNTIMGVTIRKRRSDNSDLETIKAEKGYWHNNSLMLLNGSIQKYDINNNPAGLSEKFLHKEMKSISEKPTDFLIELNENNLSSLEIIKFIKTNPNLPINIKTDFIIALNQKLSAPFMCIIAILLGIPIGSYTGRNNATFGILISIGSFFSYYGIWFLMEYLSRLNLIPPIIGIWSTTIIFLLIGFISTRKEL